MVDISYNAKGIALGVGGEGTRLSFAAGYYQRS